MSHVCVLPKALKATSLAWFLQRSMLLRFAVMIFQESFIHINRKISNIIYEKNN